ncbi:MAG: type II secretion system protein [Leptolyngbya sp. PLA1]|nr:type II secretion system protein [Leptolyngbya sp. PLA1]
MPSARRAFTLMELLVVIGIIAVLIAITFMVGRAVTTNSKKGVTQDTLRVLDSALTAYVAAKGELPPPWLPDPRTGGAGRRVPIADAREMPDPGNSNGQGAEVGIIPSIAYFVRQCESVPEAKALLDRLPSKVAVQRPLPLEQGVALPYNTSSTQVASFTVILDGWGKPIRYVHPAFSAAFAESSTAAILSPPAQDDGSATQWTFTNIRRTYSVNAAPPAGSPPSAYPDSDGGRCSGGRPYFYSAGEDGLVGRVANNNGDMLLDWDKDNVYSAVPVLPMN